MYFAKMVKFYKEKLKEKYLNDTVHLKNKSFL